MNQIIRTAARSFAQACACGTDFQAENAAVLYTR